MNPPSVCPGCGKPLPKDAPQALCPACLLKAGLESSLAPEDSWGEESAEEPARGTPSHHPERTGAYTPEHAPRLPVTTDYHQAIEPGAVIAGRYTLLEKLGEGGMGDVWVARQTEPVKRKVALKLIKAGMDSRAVLTRFEAERQALALMDHPNIARVLDGGLTDDRRPFFVMELVNGLSLTRYCDEAKLTPRERLELFVPICQAVQHAHQKGIVHRDLKPSNILVTLYDGKPVPKVIDFGVAKAMEGKLTDQSDSTQFGAVLGTLEYMAPEQASFSAIDVDTRADVYSLGVILYELLTGLRPFDSKRLRQAALDERMRILREEEPSRPSTRLSTDESLPSVAALRQTRPKTLMALMRGELDWIVMKCLEKPRDRRYESASSLARDVQRYLSDEPVEARPPSAGYRLGKLLRRNKGPVLAAAAVAAALVLGTVVAISQAIRARQAEAAALAEAKAAALARQKAERNLEIATKSVNQYLRCVGDDHRLKEKDFFDLRQKLLGSAVPFFECLAARKSEDQWEEAARGVAYWRLASLRYHMGEKEAALAAYEEARAVFEKLVADFPTNYSLRTHLAASCYNLGAMLKEQGKHAEAETAFRQAVAEREKLAADFPNAHRVRQELGKLHNELALLLHEQGKHPQAETAFLQALSVQEKLAADFPTEPIYAVDLGGSYVNFGRLARDRGEPAAALDWFARAIVRLRAVLEQKPGLATARLSLRDAHQERAKALGQLGRHAEAVPDWEGASACNDDRQRDGWFGMQRASSLARSGQHAEATAAVEVLLEPGQADAGTLYDAACVYSLTAGAAKGDPAQAEKYAARAVALLREAVQRGYANVAHVKKGPDLDPLRQRKDFEAVLAELEKASATRKPK